MAKKTINPPSIKPNRRLPQNMTPEVAQAVLEDAVLEAAADIAALTATLDSAEIIVAETPEEEALLGLLGVPFLGPTRARALADAGIRNLDDLHAASAGEIGGVKGVGMGNATRIKEWLSTQSATEILAVPESETEAGIPSYDPGLASANQEVQDLFARMDSASHLLKASLTKKGDSDRLSRQLDRFDEAASLLAEGPDTLTRKQLQNAVKTLEKAVGLLESAAGSGKLSSKKQEALADALKERRKGLEKTLSD